jgi:hypothetical protein
MDWNDLTVRSIVALTPIVTTLLVWGARLLVPKIPRTFLPLLAMLLPVVGDWLYSLSTGGMSNPMLAALLGAAAVWVRELVSTFRQHKLSA